MVDFNAVNQEGEAPAPQQERELDLQAVKNELSVYDPQIEEMRAKAESVQVQDTETMEQASELAAQTRQIKKAIESARKRYVENPNQFVKNVNSIAKKYTNKFDEMERGLKKKIAAYQDELERKRKEEERRRQEEERKRREAEEQAKAKGEEPQPEPAPQEEPEPQPEPPRSVQTDYGKTFTKKVWTFEVQDESQVPREYLVVDQKKIRQAVKDGVREIPGVSIYQETQTNIR